ncbi:MAG: AsmA-like C-terminal region-containing protein [Rhodocyclaceae bacterium]
MRLFACFAGFAILLGFLEWLEWPFLRAPVESTLRYALKREVSIGPNFGVRFIGPLRLRTDLLVIGPPPAGPTLPDGQNRDLLRAAALRLALPYATLLALTAGQKRADSDEHDGSDSAPGKRLYIDALEVAHLDATLVRSGDGRANWRFPPEKKDTGPLLPPEFGRLAIGSGEILLDDALTRLKLAAAVRTYDDAGPSLAAVGDVIGVTLPSTAAFVMHGNAQKDGALWSANIRELSIGDSRLNGDFRYDPTRRVPELSGRLGGTRLALPDLGTAQLEKLAPLKARVVLENRVLALKDIVAHSADGEVRGMLSLDARQPAPLWSADLHWSGVQLERFVKPRNPNARNGVRAGAATPGYVSGSLGGRARLHGSGRSTARMLSSLDGEAQLWVRNGRISHLLVELTGLDIAEALGMLVRGDEMLPMQCAVAGLQVREGKVWPETAVIETSDSTLSVAGVISLADERLGLVFKAQPKDKSPLTLRSPLFIEGSFAKPEVRLDKASIGTRLAAAAALAVATPLASLLALVDLGEPEKQVCQEAIQRLRKLRPKR